MLYSAEYYSLQYHLDGNSKPLQRFPTWLELPKGVPRSKNLTIPGDFLMLAEGSEVEGPIPRLVIPKKGNGDFNLDNYSVCLMSTDMQTQNGLLNFCMKGDAQLLMSQNDQGLFSFVQHFTLHDTMARGFVRPFCLAYLSQDRNKLVHFQERLSLEFSRVVSHYKKGNALMFFRDMLHTLSDLQYTREKHLENMETGAPLTYDDDDDLVGGSKVHPPAIHTGDGGSAFCREDYPNGATDQPFSPDWTTHSVAPRETNSNDGGDVDSCKPVASDFSELVDEIDSFPTAANACPVDPAKPSKDPEVQLKEFDEAIREVREILTTLSDLLEKHQIEVKDQFSPGPDQKHPRETPLDNKNFHMAQHLEDPSYRLQGDMEPKWMKWTCVEDSYKPKLRKSLRVKIQKKLRSFELLTKPAFDDYELLHSLYRYFNRAHLTLATELDDIKDLDPPEGLLTIGRVVYLNFLSNFEGSSRLRPNEMPEESSKREAEGHGTPINVLVKEWMSSDLSMVGFHACSSYGISNSEVGHLHESLEREESQQTASLQQKPMDDTQNGIGSQTHEQPPATRPTRLELNAGTEGEQLCRKKHSLENNSVVSFADHISTFSCSRRIGSGILKLFRTYQSQALDMVYSLLIGRPLVVYTNTPANEAEVRDIVTALWICVPGHYSVSPWSTKPLSLHDLVQLKLVGALKRDENLVPHCIQGSISFFDTNKKKYSGPTYKTGVLLEVANKRPSDFDEPPFVAYLHSVMFSLANKAFLYFHGFCLRHEEQDNRASSLWQRRTYLCEQSEAFSRCLLKVSGCDANIVTYLSSVVKDQLRGGGKSKESVTHVSLGHTSCW